MASSVTGSSNTASVPGLYPKHGQPRRVGTMEAFLISAAAPAVAVLFTNPFDTAKVRLQLQGQRINKALKSADPAVIKAAKENMIYKNSLDTIKKIYTNEGIKGLQKGLVPAILRESSKNLFRIGMYDPIMSLIHDHKSGSAPAWKRVLAGSFCGVMGAFSCNPFELVKTRLQSEAAGKIAVGHQHGYRGVWHALTSIVEKDGFTSLYRGSVLSMGRSIVGSGTNLASFTMMKEHLMLKRNWKDNYKLDITCGLGSAIISVLCMNPIDVVRTRYYNQNFTNGVGTLYKNGFDAITLIFKEEGAKAFYKGLSTHFMRIGPHFCFTFLFLGIFKRKINEYYSYVDCKESFRYYDSNADGYLSRGEITEIVVRALGKNDENSVNEFMKRLKIEDEIKEENYSEFMENFKNVYGEYKSLGSE